MEAAALVAAGLAELARVVEALRAQASLIAQVAEELLARLRAGGRIYVAGNGGSACEAMHFVEELVARYRGDRPALPAHHLLDPGVLTCWANDVAFDDVFRRQVEAYVRPGDAVVLLTTSGRSANLLAAARAARQQGAYVVALSGRDGGPLVALCDAAVVVPAQDTARIQEAHLAILHLWCERFERAFAPLPPSS